MTEFGTTPASWPTPHGFTGGASDGSYDAHGNELTQAARVAEGASESSRSARKFRRRTSWPTPKASDGDGRGGDPERYPTRGNLVDAVAQTRTWPTPRASNGGPDYARADRPTTDGGDNLATAAARTWPTPRASEWKGTGPLGSKSHQHRLDRFYLDATVQDAEQASGPLNPDWVEWLMGLPIGWTDPDCAEPREHPGWDVDPADVGEMPRLKRGVPAAKHRLKAIGNAVVPALGEWAARDLLARARAEGLL